MRVINFDGLKKAPNGTFYAELEKNDIVSDFRLIVSRQGPEEWYEISLTPLHSYAIKPGRAWTNWGCTLRRLADFDKNCLFVVLNQNELTMMSDVIEFARRRKEDYDNDIIWIGEDDKYFSAIPPYETEGIKLMDDDQISRICTRRIHAYPDEELTAFDTKDLFGS